MRWINAITALGFSALVAACGGGGGSAGTSPFSPAASAAGASSATSVDVLASALQVGSGGDQVTVSAIVKDANNASLAAAPVTFSANSGNLLSAATATDASGVATATFSAGSDKSNRKVRVTVTSGSASGAILLDVVGTTLSYTGVTTVALGEKVRVGVKAQDSKGVLIPNVPVTVASTLNNGLSASAITTDSQGNALVDYTATTAGTDTLTFTGAGTSAGSTEMRVSAVNFKFVSPVPNAQIPVGNPTTLQVQYISTGVPLSGKTVNFTATAGVVDSTAVTDASGFASVKISSLTSNPATVQATLIGAAEPAQATLPIEFVALTPAKIVLQVSPTALGPTLPGATAQKAKLVATVTDSNGNPVKGMTVNFNRVADPSGGNLTQPSDTTDSSGQASVEYIAGATATASDGVRFQATVAGFSLSPASASLTVNESALFIALGTGNTITNLDEQTYKKDWVVYVTDANGVSVPNMNLVIKVLPIEYGKGHLAFSSSAWVYSPDVVFCPNEDRNYNGILDSGEDDNHSGTLEPGNVISVTATGGVGVASTGTVKTDATGRATISLIYAESYVPWVKVRLRAEALVSGTESSKEAVFTVVGVASDFSNPAVAPAGVTSPFGVNGCAVPN